MKLVGLTKTNLFHFHRIFKNGYREGFKRPPLDPPLERIAVKVIMVGSSLTTCHYLFSKFHFFMIYLSCNLLMTWPVNENKTERYTHMYK